MNDWCLQQTVYVLTFSLPNKFGYGHLLIFLAPSKLVLTIFLHLQISAVYWMSTVSSFLIGMMAKTTKIRPIWKQVSLTQTYRMTRTLIKLRITSDATICKILIFYIICACIAWLRKNPGRGLFNHGDGRSLHAHLSPFWNTHMSCLWRDVKITKTGVTKFQQFINKCADKFM